MCWGCRIESVHGSQWYLVGARVCENVFKDPRISGVLVRRCRRGRACVRMHLVLSCRRLEGVRSVLRGNVKQLDISSVSQHDLVQDSQVIPQLQRILRGGGTVRLIFVFERNGRRCCYGDVLMATSLLSYGRPSRSLAHPLLRSKPRRANTTASATEM